MPSKQPEPGKCGARVRTKADDGSTLYCTRDPMRGRKRCYMHGGPSPAGPSHYNYKDGRKSRYAMQIPERMREAFGAALNDDQLLELYQEIALVESQIVDHLGRLDEGHLWDELQDGFNDLVEAQRSQDVDSMRDALSAIGRTIKRGKADAVVREEVQKLIEQKRKLADTQTRREHYLKAHVTLNEFNDLMQALASILRNRIEDKRLLSDLWVELSRAMGAGPETDA